MPTRPILPLVRLVNGNAVDPLTVRAIHTTPVRDGRAHVMVVLDGTSIYADSRAIAPCFPGEPRSPAYAELLDYRDQLIEVINAHRLQGASAVVDEDEERR